MILTRRGFLWGAGGLSLTACTVGEDFSPPTMDLPDRYLGQTTPGTAQPRAADRWWQAFQDDTLNRLVDAGLDQNLDIHAAMHRVTQAEAYTIAAGYPLSGAARVGEGTLTNRDGTQTRSGFARLEASWKLDLAGEFRREREAAGYRLDAAYADVDVARLVLLDTLITAYIDLRYMQELIRINLRVTESREKTLTTLQGLRERGKATDLSVAQAQYSLDVARANLPEARILFGRAGSRIYSLLGMVPSDPLPTLDKKAPQPLPKTRVVETGVPADLIRNRPDIRRAERRYAEALANAGVAQAQRYPSLRLTGSVRSGFSGSLSPGLPSQFLRTGLDVPLLDAPDRTARARAAQARALELLEVWKEEVVVGVEEVHTALFSMKGHIEAVEAANEAVSSAEQVLALARAGYVAEKLSFLQVLDAERSLLNAENARALDRRNLARDFVDLNVALGGSYAPPPAAPA